MAEDPNAAWSWRRARQSKLLMFLAFHAVLGVLIALLTVIAILYFDFAGIRTLTSGKPYGPVAIFALTAALSVSFASAQIAFAVLLMSKPGEDMEDDSGPKDDNR